MKKEQAQKKLQLNKLAVATLQHQSELMNSAEGRSVIFYPLTYSRLCQPETMAKNCVV
jgi:hypothetical protein